jgi:adenine/guanine phosphoribosyltransferase-like PRPP-binding protein
LSSGTIWASAELIGTVGGHIVGIGALVELTFLNGRELLGVHNVVALLQF